MPKRFLTPPTLPETTQCRGLVIPASKEWLGLFSDALLELTYSRNFEQVEPTDLTPDEVADLCYTAYLNWLDSTCGGGAAIPTLPDLDSPIYRRNPTTGRWEYLNNGEWVEPTGDDAIPEPEPRTEPTEAEKVCGAASNAANALRELYSNILDVYDDTLGVTVNQANIAFQVATAIGAQFGPVSASFLALSDFAWTVFTQALTEITNDDWSDEFEQILVCILTDAATETDGVVTFNFFEVNSNLVGFLLPVIDNFVRVRWQVWYLLQCIGEQGLNDAGGTTAVDGDCVTCNEWCVELTPEEFGFTLTTGYYDSNGFVRNGGYGVCDISLDVDTSQCKLTRVGWTARANGANTTYYYADASPFSGGFPWDFYGGGTGFPQAYLSADNAAHYSTTDTTTVRIYARNVENNWMQVEAVRLMGTGINPVGVGSNC